MINPTAGFKWRRRWPRFVASAWVVYRQGRAVWQALQLVDLDQPRAKTVKQLAARMREFQIEDIPNLGKALAEADAQLRAEESASRLRTDDRGCFSQRQVRRRFPAPLEGQGKGQRKRIHMHEDTVESLADYMLRYGPGDQPRTGVCRCGYRGGLRRAKAHLFERFEGRLKKYHNFVEARGAALIVVRQRLGGGERADRRLAPWIKLFSQ